MKQRVIMIIQARMGSSRLPGKSMLDLAGMPMVGRIIERVKRCKSLDDIVLAIPATEDDAVLKELGESHGIKVFAGPENDLVERFYQAAKSLKADIVVRLPADNATPEPTEIDRIVDFHLSQGKRGFSSNLSVIDNSGYPDGIGAEVFDFSLLVEVRENHSDLRKREHVHLNFFDYSIGQAVDEQWCPVNTIKCPVAYCRPDLILDVNTWEQYEFMRQLYEYLYPKNPDFHITDIINWYDTVYLPAHN
jgi:spore coat polysaccharide biosynthesis protein SpsF